MEGSMDNPYFCSPGGPSLAIQHFKAQDVFDKYHGGHLTCPSTQCRPNEERKYVRIVTCYVTLLVCEGRHDFCSSQFWSDGLTLLGSIVP
jgi:hypothetical protein